MLVKRIRFVYFVFCLFSFQLLAMDFPTFKANIVGKTGQQVHAYVTPLLKDGLDAQTPILRVHMAGRGHFGSKASITNANTTMIWNTFFVKQDYTLYSTEAEQTALIRAIWDSKILVYTKDVPGTLSGVCLDGVIPGIIGVAFANKGAERDSVTEKKDADMYNKENLIAIKLAELGRPPVASDFTVDDDFKIAEKVYLAGPEFVSSSTIRIILNVADGSVKFNTSYPF